MQGRGKTIWLKSREKTRACSPDIQRKRFGVLMRGSTELVKGVEKTVAPNRAKNVLPVKAIEKGMKRKNPAGPKRAGLP